MTHPHIRMLERAEAVTAGGVSLLLAALFRWLDPAQSSVAVAQLSGALLQHLLATVGDSPVHLVLHAWYRAPHLVPAFRERRLLTFLRCVFGLG